MLRVGLDPVGPVDELFGDIAIVELDSVVGESARWLRPVTLRTLDAIHLASALTLLPELDALVTYDRRLAEAAEMLGLPVVAPA